MSNSVSPLQGEAYVGFATVQEMGLRGMITIRGELSDAKLCAAISSATGVEVPGTLRCTQAADRSLAWMSPDELLLSGPYPEVGHDLAKLEAALSGHHALLANMSDARAVFQVQGAMGRQVISKLAPLDMSPDASPVGCFRRTRLAQTPAAIWMKSEEVIELICFRSVADYVFALLSRAVMPGSEV